MQTKIIQITAAKGPAECAWVVAKVLKIFLKEIQSKNITYEIIQKENGVENGTVQSVVIQLKGKDFNQYVKSWLGTIQWIGVSQFRKHHKRKNWFIGCFELSGIQSESFAYTDIEFQAIRSSGPGGQHVNKVSSAIRAKHKPTGVQVLVSDSRSQHQNKKIAVERLKAKVNECYSEKLKESDKQQWGNHLTLERGNPVKVFIGTDFKKQKESKKYSSKRNQLKNDLRRELQ